MFDVDYENDGYVYDVKQQGWQVVLTWSFLYSQTHESWL